nr:GNAT family protein [Propionicimonas sp.]
MIRDSLPVTVADGVASADFRGDDAPERYDLLLGTTRRLAFEDPAVRRLEVAVCTSDRPRRRALHRAGFRLEGVSRQAATGPDGPLDVARYAVLRDDVVGGREGFTAVMNTVTSRKRVISHLLPPTRPAGCASWRPPSSRTSSCPAASSRSARARAPA